jgi:hypothetical protein
MSEVSQNTYCNRCGSQISDFFCSNCGQAKELKYVLSEIGDVLNFDRGILLTIRELLIRPGGSIQKFISEDRSRLVKPVIFIIICSLIYTIAQQIFHFEDGYVNYQNSGDSTSFKLFAWVQENYGYANILMAVFISVWIKIFFRKKGYNFFEILILLCFVMGIGMLMYTIFGVLETVINIKLLKIGGIVGFIYSSWAIGHFFDKRKVLSYFKGFIAYILGMISFSFTLVLVGYLIDLMMK